MPLNKTVRNALFCSVSLFPLTNVAQAQTSNIDIPAEDLSLALQAYIQQSGMQLVFTTQDVGGLRSHAVKGKFAPIAALDMLLEGTRLVVTRDASGAVIVSRPLQSNTAASNPPANANTETVVVTGSRIIADAANSPTPLTVVTTAQLQQTTPTNLPDALNKLPVFIGSNTSRFSANEAANFASESLNLRDFGAQRTLVLLDGRRAVPSNADGTVNVDALPQMLVQRVDVVTGGASAVYGSDAVTGVVNFVLDKHFSGIKFDVNAGISNYEDAATYNVGLAAGADLFGGRGHVEGDVRLYHQDAVSVDARPQGAANALLTGAGTSSNPYNVVFNATLSTQANGGKVSCTGCAANGQQFIANGVLGPFNPGVPTGTSSVSVGGDGAHGVDTTNLSQMVSAEESFARFSYNLNDDTTFFVQTSITQSYNKSAYLPDYIQTGAVPNTFLYTNAYLTPAVSAALKPASGNTFQMYYWPASQGRWYKNWSAAVENADHVTAGVDGSIFGKYDWSVFYTYGHDRQKIFDPYNQNLQKLWAANDAVIGSGGAIQCFVSTTTYASLYPGCVPINPFGPSSITTSQFNYETQYYYSTLQQDLNDVGGSVSGEILSDWAGPIKAALSAEARWMDLSINTNGDLQGNLVNCTGLRLCNTLSTLWNATVIAGLPQVSENVWEVAGEINIPLLKGVPLARDLSLDIAGRYTDYSTTGSVETWKVGFDYHVNDEVRFRGTTSVDIRAPTLYDLYQAPQASHAGYTDIHTNYASNVPIVTSGNSGLMPETSRTYTGGIVFTPQFVPGLTASIDYYNLNMKNAISSISGNSQSTQALCEQSGGTSQYCALFVRPLPFSNTTTFNYPTQISAYALNSAFQRTEGWDIELDYAFALGDVWQSAPGSISLRMLANIQPVLESSPYPGAPLTFSGVKETVVAGANSASAKGHVTSFLTYNLGSWAFNLQDRWISGYPRAVSYGIYYTQPHIHSVNYQDVTIDKKFQIDGQTLDGYLSVQNVGNIQPPQNLAANLTAPGVFYGAVNDSDLGIYNPIGRYFTLGVRAQF